MKKFDRTAAIVAALIMLFLISLGFLPAIRPEWFEIVIGIALAMIGAAMAVFLWAMLYTTFAKTDR